MAQIIWNKRASRQFEQIQRYLEEEFGKKSAGIFTSRLFNFLELLAKYPEIGTLENAKENIRGFLLHRHTTILYKKGKNRIYILSVFDNRQDPGKREQ
jgi:plasmid stabilization system protein ParE